MIVNPIPHTSRFFQSENVFEATFNVPTVGKYDFGVAANTNQFCFRLQKNAVYLIERISVGGNISEESFNDSINVTPKLIFKKERQNSVIYQEPFKISNYFKNTDVSTYVWSDIQDDSITLSLEGLLDQTPVLIGVGSIKLTISLSLFVIDNNSYNKVIREGLTKNYAQKLNS